MESKTWEELAEQARELEKQFQELSPETRAEFERRQAISWVYGNCKLSNPDITLEMVAEAYDRRKEEAQSVVFDDDLPESIVLATSNGSSGFWGKGTGEPSYLRGDLATGMYSALQTVLSFLQQIDAPEHAQGEEIDSTRSIVINAIKKIPRIFKVMR